MLLKPEIVEGYYIDFEKQIGEGSYGKVYECRFADNQQFFPLCAKVIDIYDLKSAKTEGEILNILKEKAKFNPNLVNVEKIVIHEKVRQMVVIMEKCQCNLQQELQTKKQYQKDEVKEILKQILNGYNPLYQQKILHRDIKPENILISQCAETKVYKLADFGVGKIYSENDSYFTKKGTLAYAAPEINKLIQDKDLQSDLLQLKEDKSAIDIYSLGLILYQLLFGTLPFQTNGQNVKSFLLNLKTQQFQVPRFEQCDNQLVQTIEGMIKYFPSQRISYEKLNFEYLSKRKASYGIIKQKSSHLDQFFLQFKAILQNYLDIQKLMVQPTYVVQIMQLVLTVKYEDPQFKQLILQLKDYFLFDINKQYNDQQIRFLFALKFYQEQQNFDPLQLTPEQMKEWLIKK